MAGRGRISTAKKYGMAIFNRQMEACKPLEEYALLVDRVRKHQDSAKNLKTAVDVDSIQATIVLQSDIQNAKLYETKGGV